ncbi:MAG TPA: DNA-binding protein Alba [Thermoplasmatales archaeon]|nr:DNA-binding protein Alba [Thermoplasmatales archaeon]
MNKEENVVYVGTKPPMNYVLAVITGFNQGATQMTLKARGRAISSAVDAAEIVRHRFLKDVTVGTISINTEEVTSKEGESRNVSSIEIVLTK